MFFSLRVCVYVQVHAHCAMYMVVKRHLVRVGSIGPRDQSQDLRFGNKHLKRLSHLLPMFSFLTGRLEIRKTSVLPKFKLKYKKPSSCCTRASGAWEQVCFWHSLFLRVFKSCYFSKQLLHSPLFGNCFNSLSYHWFQEHAFRYSWDDTLYPFLPLNPTIQGWWENAGHSSSSNLSHGLYICFLHL